MLLKTIGNAGVDFKAKELPDGAMEISVTSIDEVPEFVMRTVSHEVVWIHGGRIKSIPDRFTLIVADVPFPSIGMQIVSAQGELVLKHRDALIDPVVVGVNRTVTENLFPNSNLNGIAGFAIICSDGVDGLTNIESITLAMEPEFVYSIVCSKKDPVFTSPK